MIQAVYNEIEPFAAAWMRELIARGHIAPGVVTNVSRNGSFSNTTHGSVREAHVGQRFS